MRVTPACKDVLCRETIRQSAWLVGALPALVQFSSPCSEQAETKHVDVLPRDEITF